MDCLSFIWLRLYSLYICLSFNYINKSYNLHIRSNNNIQLFSIFYFVFIKIRAETFITGNMLDLNWFRKWEIRCLVHVYLFDIGGKPMLRIDACINMSFGCHVFHDVPRQINDNKSKKRSTIFEQCFETYSSSDIGI